MSLMFLLSTTAPISTLQLLDCHSFYVTGQITAQAHAQRNMWCIPSKSMSFSSEGSDDSPWLYIVLVSMIFKIQVDLTASSLLDQLTRNLSVTQTPVHGRMTENYFVYTSTARTQSQQAKHTTGCTPLQSK